MDEYRPYPSEPPADDDQDEQDAVQSPAAVDYTTRVGLSSLDSGAGAESLDEEEDTVNTRRPPRRRGGDDDEDRPAPNLDHPGGHLTGTVARLNRPRRFGFLRTDDGMEIFFHASALEAGPSAFDQLRNGQTVEFDCHQDDQGRGLAASLVQVVGPPPAESQPRQQRPSREERRAARGERGERPERGERGERGGRENWRVVVLQDRADASVHQQLERLLNERNVKPGSVTFTLLDRDGGTECWVAFHTGDDGKR
jgi:cold shock CspA family protein